MEAYKILDTIGDGSFGTVFKAIVIKTGEQVAIKKMKKKFVTWDECMSLRELKSLRKLNHTNIIKLKEALKVKDELYFVFEFMEQNIYQLYTNMRDSGKSFTENQIRTIVHQTASGLAFMHKHGFFHRDLKPENLLIQQNVTKIADFGLAREIRSRPPYTDYVATRWYRAPEILLKAPNYNSPVDIFALGCIMAELYMLAPLFKGNTEMEQMYKICSILGTPTQGSWPEGLRLARQIGYSFPQLSAVNLSTLMPNASEDAIQLIAEMLRFDPQKRPSAQQVLQHPYFANFIPTDKLFPVFDPTAPIKSRKYESADENTWKSDKLFPVLDSGINLGPIKAGNYGSADEDRRKNYNLDSDFTTGKYGDIEADEHLELLEDLGDLGFEKKLDSNNNLDKGSNSKNNPIKEPLKEPSSFNEENAEDLLAEIEGYVNSDSTKGNKTINFNTSNFSGNYNVGTTDKGLYQPTTTKHTLHGSHSGNIKTSISLGPKDNAFDKSSWNTGPLGPSTYDYSYGTTNMATNPYENKPSAQFNIGLGNNDFGKYSQYGGGSNISNRGAQILNTFVKPVGPTSGLTSTNSMGTGLKAKPGQFGDINSNITYGQVVDDGSDSLGRYGF